MKDKWIDECSLTVRGLIRMYNITSDGDTEYLLLELVADCLEDAVREIRIKASSAYRRAEYRGSTEFHPLDEDGKRSSATAKYGPRWPTSDPEAR